MLWVVRGEGGGVDGRREGERWYKTAGGLEQSSAVEVTIGEGEDQSTGDGALDISAEDLQGLQYLLNN